LSCSFCPSSPARRLLDGLLQGHLEVADQNDESEDGERVGHEEDHDERPKKHAHRIAHTAEKQPDLVEKLDFPDNLD